MPIRFFIFGIKTRSTLPFTTLSRQFHTNRLKMKIALVIFAVLGLACADPRALQDDLDDFLALLPREEMRAIARRYLDSDAEFQQVVAYLQGPEWAGLVGQVGENATWQEFKAYLNEAGVDVDAIIQWIHDLINGATPGGKHVRGVREFLDEILAIIDTDSLLVLLDDKLQNSPSFIDFFETISSDEARAFVNEIRQIPEVIRIANVLREFGVDVDRIIEIISGILGWN